MSIGKEEEDIKIPYWVTSYDRIESRIRTTIETKGIQSLIEATIKLCREAYIAGVVDKEGK